MNLNVLIKFLPGFSNTIMDFKNLKDKLLFLLTSFFFS